MTGDHVLDFHQNVKGTLLLPHQCRVSISCFDSKEVQQGIISFIEESLYVRYEVRTQTRDERGDLRPAIAGRR